MKLLQQTVVLGMILAVGSAYAAPAKKKTTSGGTYQAYSAPASHSTPQPGMAGCGLGSMVIEDHGKWAQVGAAFLNGTGFQTFGISFGTSNCTEDGVATASREKEAFLEANLADVRHDIAAGKGEYLSSLASLYGCKGESAHAFGAKLKAEQSRIFGANAQESLKAIDALVKKDAALKSCQG